MSEQSAILKQIPDALLVDLTNSILLKGKYATGRTIKALEAFASDDKATLEAPAYITTLEFGRKPTKPGAPKGDPTLVEAIREWCAAKGLDPKLAYPIAKKIHKYGFLGTPGVLTEPLSNENVNKRVNETVGQLATLLTTNLASMLNI